MNKFYANKRVLVTGHTGFKGAWLSQVLLNWGADVSGVSLKPDTVPSLFEVLGLEGRMRSHYFDIRNLEDVKNVFAKEKPDIVFHLAAQPIVRVGYVNPLPTIDTNVMGTANVLEAVRQEPSVKSVVVITTDKVYRDDGLGVVHNEQDPLGGYDPYSASKAAADIITQSYLKSFFNPDVYGKNHQTLVSVARAGNVIGGGDWAVHRLVPDIIRSVYEDESPVVIRLPQAVRPWQHVLEPLSGYLQLGKRMCEGEKSVSGVWNFGPDEKDLVSVGDVVSSTLEILGKGSMVLEPDHATHETHVLRLDVSKARTELEWTPQLRLNEALTMTCNWYRNYYEKGEDAIEFTDKQIMSFFNTL